LGCPGLPINIDVGSREPLFEQQTHLYEFRFPSARVLVDFGSVGVLARRVITISNDQQHCRRYIESTYNYKCFPALPSVDLHVNVDCRYTPECQPKQTHTLRHHNRLRSGRHCLSSSDTFHPVPQKTLQFAHPSPSNSGHNQ
jgi:hypothetical protein